MAKALIIIGGLLQVLGVLLAWRALRTTREALEQRSKAAVMARNPVVPPGPPRRPKLNLPTDISTNLRPRSAGADQAKTDAAIKQIHEDQTKAEHRAWDATDALDQFVSDLVKPSSDAFRSGLLIIIGVAAATVGSII